jgi:hypothetical protein
MPAPTRRRLAALAVLSSTALAVPARAAPRVDVTAATCEADAAGIERRLANVVAAEASRELDVAVTFEANGDDVRVTVATREDSRTQGETVFLVSSCEEAADAAVLVLSLAFSAEASGEEADAEARASERALATSPKSDGPTLRVRFAAPPPKLDESPEGVAESRAPRASRVSLAAGVDVGTLVTPTAVVRAGIAHAWPALELRGALIYGLLTQNERVESGWRDDVQRDFGAAAVSLCRGFGASVRLTGCAGGEVGLVRTLRRLQLDGVQTLDEDELSPRISGVLAAILSAPRGRIRPELEVAGSALAFGRREGASAVAFRAAAGAAVDF